MNNFSWRVKICLRLSTFVLMKKKTFDDTQDSMDRKRARALDVDGWLIRLLILMLQLNVLNKLFVTAKHWKRRCTVFVYTDIIVAPKVGRKKKREKEREWENNRRTVRGGYSGQRTIISLMNGTIRAMRWPDLLGFPGWITLFSSSLFSASLVFFPSFSHHSAKRTLRIQKAKWDKHKPRERFHRGRIQWIRAGRDEMRNNL